MSESRYFPFLKGFHTVYPGTHAGTHIQCPARKKAGFYGRIVFLISGISMKVYLLGIPILCVWNGNIPIEITKNIVVGLDSCSMPDTIVHIVKGKTAQAK